MPNFKADIKIWATVRLEAEDEEAARGLLEKYVGEGAFIDLNMEDIDVGCGDDHIFFSPACTGDGGIFDLEEEREFEDEEEPST